jgi:hypothetical protein
MFTIASIRRLVLVLSLGLLLTPAASAKTASWSDLLKLLPRIGWGDSVNGGQPICLKEAQRPAHRPAHHRTSTVSPKVGCSIDPWGKTVCTP